jgi:hypothetical protein
MAELSDKFLGEFLAALPESWDKNSLSTNWMIGRAIGDALEAILKADGPGRHLHFHPPEGSILAAEGESVLIEPIESASARLAVGVSVQTVAAGTVNTEGEAVLSMLMLTGELGGKREDETCSAYLRRLLDFVASHDPGHYDDEATVKASDFVDVRTTFEGRVILPEYVLIASAPENQTIGADGKITPQKPEKPLDLADLG